MTKQEKLFWNNVLKTESCWLWLGYKNYEGYGKFSNNRKPVFVHRYSYELSNGVIKDGLTIDHLCRVRHCVNPDHLEAVTKKENISRKMGYPYTSISSLRGKEIAEKEILSWRTCECGYKEVCKSCSQLVELLPQIITRLNPHLNNLNLKTSFYDRKK